MESRGGEDRIKAVFAAVFGIDADGLTDDDSPSTLEAWDSVAHIRLVMALEAEFDIEFTPDEIGELVSVGAVRKRIGARHAAST